ncbi:hypothetical protein ACHAXT_008011 [Thalassiosira profunda]
MSMCPAWKEETSPEVESFPIFLRKVEIQSQKRATPAITAALPACRAPSRRASTSLAAPRDTAGAGGRGGRKIAAQIARGLSSPQFTVQVFCLSRPGLLLTDEVIERRPRSVSLGMRGDPAPRPSPARPGTAPTANIKSNIGKSTGTPRTGQRLRAAASFQAHPPSSLAVRRTGTFGSGGTKSLAAIAGPMGITVVDVEAPQKPWLVLNYSSSSGAASGSGGSGGGISTMAFQPCSSTVSSSDGAERCNHSSSPILLATARRNGILIWDCSGRALSPLLGRLNASDSGGGRSAKRAGSGSGAAGAKRTDDAGDGHSLGSEEGATKGTAPPPPSGTESAPGVPDAAKSLISPVSLERKASLVSVASSSSLVTSNVTNGLGGTSGNFLNSSVPLSAKPAAHSRGDVTSLAWKGPSAPILLATTGRSACVWDLRTSLFSGTGAGTSGGARPNSRFTCPRDGLHRANATLVHCAYSHDESQHAFATLDAAGAVRVWDDRKADRPLHSFVACPGGGVGIASVAPSQASVDVGPRFVTWGMDAALGGGDDLVVKVWTQAARRKTLSSVSTDVFRRSTASNVSADVDNGSDRNEDGGENSISYHPTSRITMSRAAAARVHPSFPDGILIFRENPPETKEDVSQPAGVQSTPTGMDDGADGLLYSPDQMVMRSPDMEAAHQPPPSPPPLMLEDASMEPEPEETSSPPVHEGWEVELWRMDSNEALPAVDAGEAKEEESRGAQKVVSFRGGGAEEDALSFAPGRGDVSGVIAVDLALERLADTPASGQKEELSVCTLTEAGRLTVYGVPEAANLLVREKAPEAAPKKPTEFSLDSSIHRSAASRVYRQGSDHHSSTWWNKTEEEELFGDNAEHASPKKSPTLGDASQFETASAATRGVLRVADNLTEKSSAPALIPDDAELAAGESGTDAAADAVNVQNDNLPIDPAKAARVPCPPLCGVAFSAVGGIVTFNNGPVKRMWKYYQTMESASPAGPRRNTVSFGTSEGSGVLVDTEGDEEEDRAQSQSSNDQAKKTLPRSLNDLLEMNLRSQTLQWGGDNDQPGDAASDDDGSSSEGSSSTSFEDGEVLELGSDESESDDSEGFFHVSSKNSSRRNSLDKAFDEYWAESRKPLMGGEQEGPGASDEKFVGLPSLSPSVAVTAKYDQIMIHGQTPELAQRLDLGNVWWLLSDFAIPDGRQNGSNRQADGVEGTSGAPTFPRNSSDPFMSTTLPDTAMSRSASFSPATKLKQSSMVSSLKKLFAHQLPTAMTPPDQRLLKSKSSLENQQVDQPLSDPVPSGSDGVPIGVYLLENPQTPEAAADRLFVSQKICLRNAQVCSDCGQDDKASTWTLLAQTIESIFTFEMDETDGWGGDGDALTTGIVEQILRYYEAAGDVQMLSAIVCVLTFGRDRRGSSGGSGRYQLLPKFDERRYDNYLRQYASLLYGWGLLTVRSEISKRLAHSTPGAGSETLTRLDNESNLLSNAGEAPGLGFVALCQTCAEPAALGSRGDPRCNTCGRHPFRCSICCAAVRGACTWCPLCGHGGHVDHMMQWFREQTVCPTGCGCECMLGTAGAQQTNTNY